MAIGAYAAALLLLHLHWPLELVFVASALIAAAAGGIIGVAAARLRGPYLAGATLMLAVALPSLADKYAGRVRRRPGPAGHHHHARRGSARPSRRPAGWPGYLRRRADHPGAAGEPGPQPDRPQLAGAAGQRGRRLAVRPERGPDADPRLRRQRGLRGPRRRAARGRHGHRLAGRLHPDAVDQPADRRDTRRPRQPGRGAVGQPRARLRAHLRRRTWPPATACPARQAPTSRSPPTASCSSSSCSLFPSGIQGGLRRLLGPVAPAASAPFNALRGHAPASEHQEEGTT